MRVPERMRVHVHVGVHERVFICMRVCMLIYGYMNACKCICINAICMYVCTHLYARTHVVLIARLPVRRIAVVFSIKLDVESITITMSNL